MRTIAIDKEEPASARVAAARLATELDAEAPAGEEQPADQASIAELDEVIARLERRDVGKA